MGEARQRTADHFGLERAIYDPVGHRVPTYLRGVFLAAREMAHKAATLCQQSQKLAESLLSMPGADNLDVKAILECFDRARLHIHANRPLFVCPSCWARGSRETGCGCKGKGWLSLEEANAIKWDKHVRYRFRQNALRRANYHARMDLVVAFFKAGDFTLAAIEKAPKDIQGILKRRIGRNPPGHFNPDGIKLQSSRRRLPRVARAPRGQTPAPPEPPPSAP